MMLLSTTAVSLLLVGSVLSQSKEFQKEADPPLNCSATERARSVRLINNKFKNSYIISQINANVANISLYLKYLRHFSSPKLRVHNIIFLLSDVKKEIWRLAN
jgi:hypothetical protein